MGVAYVVGTVVMNFGLINVAASAPHSALFRQMLHTTAHNAIGRAAANIEVADLTTFDKDAGERIYRNECGVCHSGPGLSDPPLGQGLNPPAPELTGIREHWNDAELFWIIKHGIRMTCMPAFGHRLSDEEIWSTVRVLSGEWPLTLHWLASLL